MKCRHCQHPLTHIFLDLGKAPPSNAYLTQADLNKDEIYYPLRLFVCEQCWLVQTEDFTAAGSLFDKDYAYFSSISKSWVEHARRYVEMITGRLQLDRYSFVVEIASNDGYLLQHFLPREIPCLGIEPTASTAAAAEQLGIPVVREFFGTRLAATVERKADLIIGNNVYAHVPDINDFTAGMKVLLKPEGVITLEFPHLMRLIEQRQFDTVYHEHFSYLSLGTVSRIFRMADLRIWDVEELPTHGGSLRIYGCHEESMRTILPSVAKMLEQEMQFGLSNLEAYRGFQSRAEEIRQSFLDFLHDCRQQGKSVAAYGAAAKGNTLLNYCGVTSELIAYVCDAAPSKQGKFLPGSHIPIVPPAVLRERKPHRVIILPWNIAGEIMAQHAYIKDWGGSFVTAIPTLRII